ncbi:MAG: transporter substrate-binding domain-containing protein [Promethearchaeota archaeon]
MTSKRLYAVVITAIICCGLTNSGVFLYAYISNQKIQENTQQTVIKTGVIRLGTSPDYPPFESIVQKENGLEIVGLDIALAQKIVENLSVAFNTSFTLRIEAVFFNSLLAGLDTGSYDMVIAAMTIRADRELQCDFSVPYYYSRQCCVVPASDSTIKNESSLDGLKVAVQQGTSGQEIAGTIPGIQMVLLPTIDMILLSLSTGENNAAIMDIPVAQYFAKKGDVKIAFNFTGVPVEGFGVALRNGEGGSEMMAVINSTIIALNESGELDRMFQEYFG